MNDFYHKSVLLNEVIDFLNVKPGEKYIDATLGGGGHAREILEQGGTVLGIDVDIDALSYVSKAIKNQNLKLVRGNFKDIDQIAKENGFANVSGIIFDLGISSHQIDEPRRGFSYQFEGPLDMRMDQEQKIKASDLLNILTKGELYELFTKLGEESRARTISDNIVRARRVKAFASTRDLTDIVEQAYGLRGDVSMKIKARVNRKVFQALRMAVNQEKIVLEEALPKALSILLSGGRLCVISFHSIEDKITKDSFKKFEAEGWGKILTEKPVVPSFAEASENRRSASAKLRVFEKK